ncbi:MAG: hypothetical protein Phyf2KO_07750 [Phycisphaerales bacterium]
MTDAQANQKPSPLVFVLAVTFILSIGTGSLTHGLGFIAKQSAGFNRSQLFGLGVVFGITYIISSRMTGPVVRSLESKRKSPISAKALLMLITFAGAVAAAIPLLLAWFDTSSGIGFWLVAAGYGGLTGIMWPIVEWNIAGGRRNKQLRSAAGQFNIVWTAAVVVAFWMMAPTLERMPMFSFVGIIVLHLLAVALMIPFPAKPPKHLADTVEPDAPNSKSLLVAARTLLPMSYTLAGVLGPFFPVAMAQMEIDLSWQTVIVSVWMTTRIPTMVLLERWHGWHGKAWPLTLGAMCVVLGFTGCIVAPVIGGTSAGIAALVAALVLFGAGKGLVYTAAIYYALEVGEGEIDSGATHEALIGVGYALGPAMGLLASVLVTGGVVTESAFTPILLTAAVIGSLALSGAILLAHRRAH